MADGRIDALATSRHYWAHLEPIWEALDPSERGQVWAPRKWAARWDPRPGLPMGDGNGRHLLVAAAVDLIETRRRRRHVLANHGAGQSYHADPRSAGNPSYAGGRLRDTVDLFLEPGGWPARLDREAWPDAAVEVVGAPNLDRWHAAGAGSMPGRVPTVAFAFHWHGDRHGCVEMGSAVRYFGAAVGQLAGDDRWRVIGHGHPKGPGPARTVAQRSGVEWVEELSEIYDRADLLIADNTSALFEFASLDRPVVVLNSPEWRRDVHHGGRFWEWACVGVNVDRPGDLVDAVALALEDPAEVAAERAWVVGEVYGWRDGRAAERAAEAIRARVLHPQ